MSNEIENKLNQGFDEILLQLSKGNTIGGLKQGKLWMGFEQIKEWKSLFGYQFHIHPNDHFIDKKPHFHLKKISESIDCRLFFDGTVYDCQGTGSLEKKVINAIEYFLSKPDHQNMLVEFWNIKNPKYKF